MTPAQSLQEIKRAAKDLQAKPLPGGLAAVVVRADPQARHPYHGKIVAATEHHALQQLGANKFVIHDRSKGAVQDLTVGNVTLIRCPRPASASGAGDVATEKVRLLLPVLEAMFTGTSAPQSAADVLNTQGSSHPRKPRPKCAAI